MTDSACGHQQEALALRNWRVCASCASDGQGLSLSSSFPAPGPRVATPPFPSPTSSPFPQEHTSPASQTSLPGILSSPSRRFSLRAQLHPDTLLVRLEPPITQASPHQIGMRNRGSQTLARSMSLEGIGAPRRTRKNAPALLASPGARCPRTHSPLC